MAAPVSTHRGLGVTAVQLRVLGGALARVPNDATGFAHRDRRLSVNVTAMYADAAERETHAAWAARLAASFGKDGADNLFRLNHNIPPG